MSNTAERLKEYMEENKMSQADIIRKCEPYCKKYDVKITSAHLSQWVKGKFAPKQDKLAIIGMALGLNEAWLMGYDVPKERQQKTIEINNNEHLEIAHENNVLHNSDNYDNPNILTSVQAFKIWREQIGHHSFTEEEIIEIANFTKYILSRREGK